MSAQKRVYNRQNNVISTIQKTIKLFGLSSDAKRLHYWLAQIALVCFVILIITQTIAIFMAREDTEKLFECVSTMTFCSMAVLKLISLRKNHAKWKTLLLELCTLEYEQLNNKSSDVDYESDDEDTKECIETHVTAYTEKFHSLSLVLYRVYYSTLTIFILEPFIECLYWKFTSGINEYPHVLPGWSPLETISFWGYLVTMLVELVAAIFTTVVHFVFDLIVFGLMIFLSGQFLLLRKLSESIAGVGKGYDQTQRRDNRAHFRIMRCHRILAKLETSVFKLNTLVQTILGIYFLVAVLTLCSVALRLNSEEMSMMKVATLVQYIGASITQLFLFCYYGDMVINESSVKMGEGVYAAAWWRLSPRLRREAAIFGAWQMRSRRLRAGPFNRLDLPSFIQIIRAAYSYYAVLRKKE